MALRAHDLKGCASRLRPGGSPCRLWCEAELLEELQLVEIQPPFRDLPALDRVDRTPSDPDGLVRRGNGLAARTRERSRMSPREGPLEADQHAMHERLIP